MTYLKIENEDDARIVRLTVTQLTSDSADRIFDEIRQAVDPARALVIDTSRIDFIDSCAIGELILLARQLKSEGIVSRISGLNTYLFEMFKMMHLEQIMDFSMALEGHSSRPAEALPQPLLLQEPPNTAHAGEQSLTMAIESRLSAVSGVSTCIRALCLDAGLEDMTAYQVQTCSVEAINNAVIHAYDNEPGHQIEIRWSLSGSTLRIQITDTGKRMTQMPPAIEPDPFAESGRGWWIMKQWMDSADYRSANGRNTVTLRKVFPE